MRALATATVIAAGLAGCGDADPGSGPDAPAQVTPVPSGTPAPSPGDDLHADQGSPTPSPSHLRPDGEGGDERGIRVRVGLRVGRRDVRSSRAVVPAFLALRLHAVNLRDRRVRLIVGRTDDGAGVLGRLNVPGRGAARLDLGGLSPGAIEVRSPDLGPSSAAVIRIEPGAG